MKKTIGVIGGDLRQKYLADALHMPIAFYANESILEGENISKCHHLNELFLECDIIVVPIPFSRDQKNIFSRYFDKEISVDSFLSYVNKNHLIIGGPFSIQEHKRIKELGAKLIDITSLETFKLMNAIPTAEGVLSEVILKLDKTIHGSRGLILGYGYCGRRIAHSIRCLGGIVEIYTENSLEKKTVTSDGFIHYEAITNQNRFDYTINTIPKVILKQEGVPIKMLFIDITEFYQWESDCFVKMRGIPGKFSPRTAGMIIGELLNDLILNVTGENS
ncbi:MAG: hypothetical protein H7X94_02460 [Vallitaleaceae bacterium]|nr:hypothetical protein [Vallitaleaceae bacterium]